MSYDAKYAKRWRVDRARGITRMIDAEPARLHIATLEGAGWSLRAIAGAAGLPVATVARARKAQRLNRTTVTAVCGVPLDSIPRSPSYQTTEPFVPRIGTRRRLEALLYMGWTWSYLRQQYGIRPATSHQQGRWVTRTTHDKVAAAYRELSHRVGPSEVTRRRARALGYVGPTAWADIDLDAEPEREEAPA